MTDLKAPTTLRGLKSQAKQLKKANPGMLHTHALEVIARSAGFRTYAAAKAVLPE